MPEDLVPDLDDQKSHLSPSSSSSKTNVPLFEIKKWDFVTFWKWIINSDACAICRADVSDSCLKCQSENKTDDCITVWGQCNHSFHNCCMLKWIQQSNRCPLCQQEWINCVSHQIHRSENQTN